MYKEAFLGQPPSKFKPNGFVRAYIISDTFFWSGANFVFPILSIFVANYVVGGNIEIAGSSVSAYYITRIITELFSGRTFAAASEKTKLRVALFGIFVVAASLFSFAFIQTIPMVFLLNGLIGFGLGFSTPSLLATFSTHLDKNKEATEWSIYDASVFIGMALSAALGGFIAEQYGFQVLFIAAAVIVCIAALPYVFYLRTLQKRG